MKFPERESEIERERESEIERESENMESHLSKAFRMFLHCGRKILLDLFPLQHLVQFLLVLRIHWVATKQKLFFSFSLSDQLLSLIEHLSHQSL